MQIILNIWLVCAISMSLLLLTGHAGIAATDSYSELPGAGKALVLFLIVLLSPVYLVKFILELEKHD